jgi:hypothetical protein
MTKTEAIDAMDAAMDLGYSISLRGASRPNMMPDREYTVKLEFRSTERIVLEELAREFASSGFELHFQAWPEPASGPAFSGFYLVPR